jgi:phage tail sheath protein FI
MAEKIISPGVFTRENDLSFLPQGVGEIGAAIVGPTVKGPVGIPTQVTSYAQYVDIFGNTFKSGSDYFQYLTSHTAEHYLKDGGPLTVVRIAGDEYSHASSSVSTGEIASDGTIMTGSLVYDNSAFQDEGDEVQITVGGVEYRIIGAAAEDDNFPADDSPIFFASTGSTPTLAISSLAAKINAIDIGVSALAVGATNLELTASAAGNQVITVQTGSGGTIETNALTLGGGINASASVAFNIRTISDGDNLNNYQESEGINHVLESGSKDNIRWEVTNVDTKVGTFNLVVRRGNDSSVAKIPLETWSNLSLDPNASNYISKVIGDMVYTVRGSDDDPYLQLSGSYSNKSRYIRVEVLKQTVDYLDENGDVRIAAASQSLPVSGTSGSFNGGADGNKLAAAKFYENISAANCQGYDLNDIGNSNGGTSYAKALNLLANQDEYDINMLLVPGANQAMHGPVIDKAIKVAESRGDCFVVADPVGYGAGSMVSVTEEAAKYNSSYAAMYWPWVQVPDNQLNKLAWVPAGVVLPGVLAFNDRIAHEWYAPAGLNRGGVDVAVRAERKLTHTNRDALYAGRVNPLATFPGQGVVVWGQKTLQKKASALDRVNVRRLLINLKKFIASTSKYLVFENNTNETRNRFLSTVVPYMERVQQNNGLYAFKVVMDDSNNTPDIIDRNIMKGDIFIQPAKAAEFIVVDFNVMPTGATFGE